MSDGIVRALAVHGVGEQKPDFADFAIKTLGNALGERRRPFFARSVCWAGLADAPEAKYLRQVRAHGSQGNMAQRLAIGTLSDALSYEASPKLRAAIFDLLDKRYCELRADGVVLLCHSLGCLAVCDWLRARPSVQVERLFTFGCNIGLFSLGQAFDCPEQLRAPGVWVNAFYPSDILGYPLAGGDGLGHVRDLEVRKPFWRWSTLIGGLSHVDYWTDRSLFAETIASRI